MVFQHSSTPIVQAQQSAKERTPDSPHVAQSVDQPLASIETPQFQRSFSEIPVHAAEVCPTALKPIQAKLKIGQIGDRYEQEADRVAHQVVQQIHSQSASDSEFQVGRVSGILQRQADGGKSELEGSIDQVRGGGQPLEDRLRDSMERSFRTDFSQVRVHTDAQSDRLNRSIQAKAFTTGQDIFFSRDHYDPKSRSGQELIAHELTHVVQQNGVSRLNSQDASNALHVSTLSDLIIQRTPVSRTNVTQAIENYRTNQFKKAYTDFVTQHQEKILVVKEETLLWAAFRSIRGELEQSHGRAANTITMKKDLSDFSGWGDIEDYSPKDVVHYFADAETYKQEVEAANKRFTESLDSLANLVEKMPKIYQSIQEELEKESLGESLSTKLQAKLEALKKKEEPTGTESSLQVKLTAVTDEMNTLKKVTLQAEAMIQEVIKSVKENPTIEAFTTEEGAKQVIRTLVGQRTEIKEFRANQKEIQRKAELFLAFFDSEKEDATLSESTGSLPIDQPEIHQYYLKYPKLIAQPIVKTIWSAQNKDIVLKFWSYYKESWLDALHLLSADTINTTLSKLVKAKTDTLEGEGYLLQEAPPASADATKIRLALNALSASHDKKDFFSRYEIGKIGSNMGYREVLAPQSKNFPEKSKNPAVDRIGYVINVATIPSAPSPSEIAEKYYAEGFDDKTHVKERLAIVVGVNKFRSLDKTSDNAVKDHANKTGFDKFALVSFGFTWDFNWQSKTSTDAHGFDGAFKAFKEQDDDTRSKALAYQREHIRIQDRLPYAQFKERVTAHPKTRELVELLGTYNKYVYIHLGDSDAVSLKAPEEQQTTSVGQVLKGNLAKSGTQPQGLFSRYDVALSAESKPFMAIGGYEFRTQGTTGEQAEREKKGDLDPNNLEHLLTYLANQLDMAVRIAVAKEQPKAVYPTEPNLVFMAMSPDYSLYSDAMGLFDKTSGNLKTEGSLFGEGAREGRKLQRNLVKAREGTGVKDNKTVYDPRLGIATGSDRFRLEGTAHADYKPVIDPITKAPNSKYQGTYEQRRKNKIRTKTGTERKDEFKSQIIEDIANQPQTYVQRALKLEINEVFSKKIEKKGQVSRFTNRISNVLAQKYIKKDKFTARLIEQAHASEKDNRVKTLETVIQAVVTTLNDSKLDPLWKKMNEVIDALYDKSYQTD